MVVGSMKAKVSELEQKVVQLEAGHQWVQDEACKAMGIASKVQLDVNELQQSGSCSSSDGSSGSYRSAKQHRWQSSSHSEAESSGSEGSIFRRRSGRRVVSRCRYELPKPKPAVAAMESEGAAVLEPAAEDSAMAAAAAED